MKSPEFLKNKKEIFDDSALNKLKLLVKSYLAHQTEIEKIEDDLKEKKKLFNEINQTSIPELLHTYGLSEIKLDTGEKIIVKEGISVSIENEKAFFSFLKDRKEDDIIKTHYDFNKMESEKLNNLFEFLDSNNYDYESKKGVHSQTLKKYIKELIGMEKDDLESGLLSEKYKKKEEIESFVKIFNFFSTKIK